MSDAMNMPTLRGTVDSMHANIKAAHDQLDRLRGPNPHWIEGSFKNSPRDEGDRAAQWRRFKAEVRHWQSRRDYWRGLLDRHPGLADEPAAVAIDADQDARIRFYPEAPGREEPAPNDDSQADFEDPLPF